MTVSVAAPRQVDWGSLRGDLGVLNVYALEDLLRYYSHSLTMDPTTARMFLQQAVEDLVAQYGTAAADMAAQWWNDVAPASYQVPYGHTLNMDQERARIRWATYPIVSGEGSAKAYLAGVLQHAVFGAQRMKIHSASAATGVAYARIARPDACAFCRLLASRGAVYGSTDRALRVGGRVRGTRKAGMTYHDHCRCVAAPKGIPGTRLDLPDYTEKFYEEYYSAVKATGSSTPSLQQVTAKMREHAKQNGMVPN